MKKILVTILFLFVFSFSTFAQTASPSPIPVSKLKVGDAAPDFELIDVKRQKVKLSDFKGKKNVVLAFYVLAFTGGWTKELTAYQADIAKFEATDTQVIGISMDSFASNERYGKDLGVTFPLLSDWNRKTTRDYGLFNEESGYGRRGTFVIDKEGIIQKVEIGNTAIDPTGAYETCSLLDHKKKTEKKP